jgi:hypothetical protein
MLIGLDQGSTITVRIGHKDQLPGPSGVATIRILCVGFIQSLEESALDPSRNRLIQAVKIVW